MKKKLFAAVAIMGVLTLSFGSMVFASQGTIARRGFHRGINQDFSYQDFRGGFRDCIGFGMRGIMWDDFGGIVSQEVFEQRLDELIAQGFAAEIDRAFMLEMFEHHQAGGLGGRFGGGFCGGLGRGRW